MRKKLPIETRPNYYHGQLLLEDDFVAEQNYHVNGRHRHNLNLHGWGIVRGLEIFPQSDYSITVSPGFAIDKDGRDIPVDQAESLDLSEFGPNDLVKISLAYEEEPVNEASVNRRKEYAVLTASHITQETTALVVAILQLDGQGKVRSDGIDYSKTKYTGAVLAPGSVTAAALSPELRTGWLRMPFRPIPLVDIPKGESKIPDAFRVGVTRALTPAHEEAGEKDPGAGGTMAIGIPPSVKKITRFRILGEENKGEIIVQLYLGGWDPVKNKHVRELLLDAKIAAASPFKGDFAITNTAIDPEYHTLSLWLRGTRRASISLVAVEFAY
jgi:hypothetical protein